MVLDAIETVLVILLLMLIGVFISWKDWYGVEHKLLMTKLIVNISIPAVTINNFFNSFPRTMIFSSGKLFLIPLTTMLASFLLGSFLSNILKIDRTRRGSFIAMCTVSNSIFIGLPVSIGLFGEESIPYVMFYYLANTIVFWGLCSPRIKEDGQGKSFNFKEFIKNMFSVPLITVLISLILVILNLRPPNLILDTAKYLGNMSTPLSLIFIGGIMYEIGLKNIKIDISMVFIMLMRFILAPLLTLFICQKAGLEKMATQVFTIQTAMPVMIQTVTVSENYKADSQYVATAVTITTLISLIFIPFYMSIMSSLS